MKSFFSNRIYKNTLNLQDIDIIQNSLYTFNCAKIQAYKLLDREKSLEKSLHLTIKDRFSMNDYFTNSCIQEVKGLQRSNIELNKLYIENTKLNIKQREFKIKEVENKLKYQNNILKYIIDISKAVKYNKKFPKMKRYLIWEFININNKIYVCNNKTHERFNLYDYEHLILKLYIKKLKNRLGKLIYGLNIQKQKLKSLETKITKSCFGTKKLFKSQYTIDKYINNHNLWKKDYYKNRNKSLTISGRLDAKYGNFSFKYNNKQLKFKSYDNRDVIFPLVYFPYGQKIIENQLNNRIAITWNINDLGDYYIIKCIIDIPIDKSKFNYSKSTGVIGYDINYDHIAYSNIDEHGNLLNTGVIKYNLTNKNSNQTTKILEKVAIELVDIANKYNKTLIGEKLNTEKSKSQLIYGNKKRNKIISMFAYRKAIDTIKTKANKQEVEVCYINPAYTSIIGKYKYMKPKGISIHQSASYVIGRRGMNFKEKLPKEYQQYVNITKHHWTQWNMLNKYFEKIKEK